MNALGHPNLEELPDGLGSHSSCNSNLGAILARERALDCSVIQRTRPRLSREDFARDRIDDTGRSDIIAEPGLDRLVNVQKIDMVVPRPRVQDCGVRIGLCNTRSVLTECLVNGRRAGTTLKPDAERGGLGRVARLEEPEEDLLLVRLKASRRKS